MVSFDTTSVRWFEVPRAFLYCFLFWDRSRRQANAATEDVEVHASIQERFYNPSDGPMSNFEPRRARDGRHLTTVRDYMEAAKLPSDATENWCHLPEFPSASEICPLLDPDLVDDGPLPRNLISGSYETKLDYLGTQYRLVRENCTRSLRDSVAAFAQKPDGEEKDFESSIGLYDNVTPVAVTYTSNGGIAVRVVFTLQRVGKKIAWAQSKRLISGSLVALTPVKDCFREKCIMAYVAARPLSLLEEHPPAIDLCFPRESEIPLDPQEEYIMVEDRGAYYEADRHTMLALQKMMKEP